MCMKLLVLLICFLGYSKTYAASLVKLQLITDGATNFPGDQVRLSVLFRSGEKPLAIEVRAYQAVEQRDGDKVKSEIKPIVGRGDGFRDSNGAFMLKRMLTREGEMPIHELVIDIPYEKLELPVGRHRIGYEVKAVRGDDDDVEFTTATGMSVIEVLEQARTTPLLRLRKVLETVTISKPLFVSTLIMAGFDARPTVWC